MSRSMMLCALVTLVASSAITSSSVASPGEAIKSYGMQVFMLREESGAWTAYNDCSHASGDANITQYSGFFTDGGGFEVPSGLLKDYSSGNVLSVTATLEASNVASSISSLPNGGTEANTIFGFFPNFGPSASYNNSGIDWYYKVTFTGLDPSKSYEFVTTANRNSASYDGVGSASRWTRFYILDADTYTNASTPGVVEVTPDNLEMNTGYNTVNGYVIRWTGVTSSSGSFTVISQNVGAVVVPVELSKFVVE